MNNPSSFLGGNPQNANNILQILQFLCQHQVQLKINVKGSWMCSICKKIIGQNQENLNLDNCFHSVHRNCLVQETFRLDQHLNEDLLRKQMKCSSCSKPISIQIIKKAIGEQKFDQIQIEYLQILDKELYIEERKQRQLQLDNKTEACAICGMEYNYKDIITLECEHRFCRECLQSYIENQISDGKVKREEMVCPQEGCKETIDINIIKSLINPEQFEKFEKFLMNNLTSDNQDIKYAYCPMADCTMIMEYNVQEDRYVETCQKCNTKFCIRGCPNPHEGKTCKEYFDLQQLQMQSQQQFDDLVRQGTLKVCPHCQVNWIQNGGCAYVVCFKCKNPICLKCNPQGVKYGTCPCGRWHG